MNNFQEEEDNSGNDYFFGNIVNRMLRPFRGNSNNPQAMAMSVPQSTTPKFLWKKG